MLVHTLMIADCLLRGTLDDRPFLASRFALTYPGERVLGVGPYDLRWWGAVGDGSWSIGGSTFVAGTGRLGMGLVAGSLIVNQRAKSRARAAAAADATLQWRPVDQGHLHVTTHAFYFTDGAYGHRMFPWEVVQQVDVTEPGVAHFTGDTDQGSQTWRLTSTWAELLFATWVIARRHPHPQWLDGSWFPYETMRERCTYYGYSMPELPS